MASTRCAPLAHPPIQKETSRVTATTQRALTQRALPLLLGYGTCSERMLRTVQPGPLSLLSPQRTGTCSQCLGVKLKNQSNKVIFGAPEARIAAPL